MVSLFGRLLTGKGHKGIFWGARNVLYLDLGGGYMYVYIGVVVSYCCCKKLPQTWCLKTLFILLQFWRSEVQDQVHCAKIKVSAGLCLNCDSHPATMRDYRGESVSLPFPVSRAAFLHLQSPEHNIWLQSSYCLLSLQLNLPLYPSASLL